MFALSTYFRAIWLFFGLILLANPLWAASVEAKDSHIKKSLFGAWTITIATDAVVPARVRYLDEPYRVIVEFEGLSLDALPANFGDSIRGIKDVRALKFGQNSSLVLAFETPFIADEVDFSQTAIDGHSGLRLRLKSASAEEFSAQMIALGADASVYGRDEDPTPMAAQSKPLIVIDPGHGGDDPGALRAGVQEKTVTLAASVEIKSTLEQSGRYQVLLTREDDSKISLLERRQFAERMGADVFLSIHADALEAGEARGTTIYQLSDEATSQIAAHFSKFENRADLFSGENLNTDEQDLSLVMADLAHQASRENATRLALILQKNWVAINDEPSQSRLESAAFGVLKAPEIPSLLLEIGYLSDDQDLAKIQNPNWLKKMSDGVLLSLDKYFEQN